MCPYFLHLWFRVVSRFLNSNFIVQSTHKHISHQLQQWCYRRGINKYRRYGTLKKQLYHVANYISCSSLTRLQNKRNIICLYSKQRCYSFSMSKTYEVLAIKICYHWVNFTQIYDVYYEGKVENGIYRWNKSIICKLDNHNNKYIRMHIISKL